ncbi:GTPase-associated protein 1-related protein [Streptomyces hokutonensis]|uniref:GTPase-associated protein 1-related protein n=1 Tax=Streptomyces hokutonensis TaxID=1306990 RepID=UPI00036883EA|nr:GTPase-associated protein 1-related protein [Streptomyces hokutonensis]
MTLAQLHYTSAPPGPDGSGFRFTAVSAGVPQGLLREAEQLIGYEPPRDCPARPDAEQLKGFPKAFSFSELADGGRLLSRTVYIGADYSGRWGNFHAHAVHLPSGTRLPDGALPITAWESPRWADATPPDGRPEPVDRIEPSGVLRKEALVAFAVSRAGWLAPFFADLRAVAADPGAGQLVVVEHDSADVAQWIALACAVLPREQAHRLTFTTYTRRPQQARQQIVGALPSSESVAHDHRYRVHDCTGRQPSGPVADTWAEVCARIWRAGRADLFHNDPEDLGQLAVTALTAGIELRADARATAARWAAEGAGALSDETLTALVAGLCGGPLPAPGAVADEAEQAALAALLARLDGQVPTVVSAPLAARVLASAVLGRGPVPMLRAGSLTPRAHDELARDLAPTLRAGLADPQEPPTGRPLALLRVADLLDIDCQDQLPDLAGRLARELVSRPADPAAADGDGKRSRDLRAPGQPGPTDRPGHQRPRTGGDPLPDPPTHEPRVPGSPPHSPRTPSSPPRDLHVPDPPTHGPRVSGLSPHNPTVPGRPDPVAPRAGADRPAVGCPPALLDAVHAHPGLRVALFGSLNALAVAEPTAVAGVLTGSGLPVAMHPGFPHLRMCVTPARAGDRLARFHEVVRTAGVSPHADPTVLRTALRLTWPGELPTGQEASLLLNELGSDTHRAAGTRDLLIEAALGAPRDDRDVPALAVDLLRCFNTELRPGQRAALLLLEFTGLLGTEGEGEEWVRRVLNLRDGAAEPVPDPVVDRAFRALARRLLDGDVPENELYALARSGEPRLLAAYERAGRSDRVGDRLRTVPAYVAARFCDWSAFPGTHPAWDETRTTLLTKVLRPIVRVLPAEDLTEVESALGRAGRGKLDAYRAWNRPGALGRLAGRLSGRGRRPDQPGVWSGDMEPPSGGGRR